MAVIKGLAAAIKAGLASGAQSRRSSLGVAIVVFIMLLGGGRWLAWFVAEARAVKTIVSLYIKASSLG